MSTGTNPVPAPRWPRRKKLFVAACSVLLLAAVAATVIAVARMFRATADRDFILKGQAAQLARTGLTEAMNWLRRQPSQPVETFAPTDRDSMDPGVGLVREFPITGDVWGRFEVWRAAGAGAASTLHRESGVDDVSLARGYDAPGVVWRLRSVGYVFERQPAIADLFDRDRILHREVLEVEVSRLGLRLPGQAALCVRGGQVEIGRNARVSGGADAAGIYAGDTSRMDVRDLATAGRVTGVVPLVPAPTRSDYDDSVLSVFGVGREALLRMADEHITHASYFPARIRPGSVYLVEVEELDCTAARPLRGQGILFVAGNLTLSAGSASRFTGLLYVDGDLVIRSGAELTGAVVVTGNVSIQSAEDTAVIRYDDEVLSSLAASVGVYRTSSKVTRAAAGPVSGAVTPARPHASPPARAIPGK